MRIISAVTRRRLEMQGFVGFDDGVLAALRPRLRLTPALCMLWIVGGSFLASPGVLSVLIPVAAFCALRGRHPFDFLYNVGARALHSAQTIPLYAMPRRFACMIVTIWMAFMSATFYVGAVHVGRWLGIVIVSAMLITVCTDFCLPCFIYARLFVKQRS